MEINERIKFLRSSELRLTQQEFSNALGITRSSLSVIEIGKVSVTKRNIKTICDKFDVNEEWLCNGIQPIFNESPHEEIYQRVKKVRNYFNLNQTEFGKRIGLTRSAIAKLEIGNRNLTNQTINSIVREFNINENWLIKGQEPMFKHSIEEKEIYSFIQEAINDNKHMIKKHLLSAISKLDDKSWDVIEQFIIDVINESNNS